MKRGKSKIVIAGYAALAMTVLMCGSTLAYFIYHEVAINTFTVGSQVSEIDEVWTPPEKMTAGKSYTKNVTVRNTGTSDCYARVFAEITDEKAAGSVAVDWNTADWTGKQADGYYYYKQQLAPGEKTKPLFTTLTASSDLSDFDMIVYEETVQAQGADSPQEAFDF